jgi:hypothetical protein
MIAIENRIEVCDKSWSKEQDKSISGVKVGQQGYIPSLISSSIATTTSFIFAILVFCVICLNGKNANQIGSENLIRS